MMIHLKKHIRRLSVTQKHNSTYTKIFLIVLVFTACALTIFWDSIFYISRGDINCFYQPGNVLTELKPEEPTFGESIFYHETSCHDGMDIYLMPRQACSVESALLAHPTKDVFLLVSRPSSVPIEHTKNVLVRELLNYSNFKIRHVSFSKYLADTPLAYLDKYRILQSESLYPVSHASDILRFVTLYKYGGIYLDLDVLVLKPLAKFTNIAGIESDTSLGSGILGFGSDTVGREVARECVQELKSTFNGQLWGHNGPGVITRVLERRCNTSIPSMTTEKCHGFDVEPSKSFTPISYMDIEMFFVEDKQKMVPKLLNGSYTVHFWNKLSSNFVIDKESNVPFVHYARTYCPNVFRTVSGRF